MITGRTQADAERWQYLRNLLDTGGWSVLSSSEQAEWLTCVKGGYNHTDLNRVGTAVAFLSGRYIDLIYHLINYRALYGVASDPLFEVPYAADDVSTAPKTDWLPGDIVYVSHMARYVADLTVLRRLITLPADTPQVPSDMEDLTIAEANDIEKLLVIIDVEITKLTDLLETWIRNTANAWLFSGDPYSGEV